MKAQIKEMARSVAKNSAAIKKMEDVSTKVDKILNLMGGSDHIEEKDESRIDSETENVADTEPENPIDSLVSRVNGMKQTYDFAQSNDCKKLSCTGLYPTVESEEATDDSLIGILQDIPDVEEYGTALNADVSKSINRLFTQEYPKDQLEKLKEKNKIPENCKALIAPKVNREIWSALPARVRQSDFNLQSLQRTASLASVQACKLAEKLFVATNT